MRIEAICIGDELLDGRVRDRNSAALGEFLADRGAALERLVTVPDDVDAIVDALRNAEGADLVVVSGGLGPTDDDRTRQAAARWRGVELELHPTSLDRIRQRFESRGRTFTENNRKQAMFPAGATPITTEIGTAPAFSLDDDDGPTTFFFPGVPREFRWYLENTLRDAVPPADSDTIRSRLQFHGIGESSLETRIDGAIARRESVAVGYRADYPIIEMTLRGGTAAVAAVRDEIVSAAGAHLVGEGDEDLPARVGRALLERGETICTAESCTAGGIAALITETPGSSAWFQRGYVTYANDAKVDELGVSDDVLLRFGAVSAQTVCQMAAGAKRRARATHALAVSGIAGPGGGTPEKPVGTVHFGLAAPGGTYHRLVHYRLDDRRLIREGTAYSALALLLWLLEERLDEHAVSGPFSDDAVWSEIGIEPDGGS